MTVIVNPYTKWPVSQGWREGSHAKPGGGPAIDYAAPWGSTLLAPAAGRVSLSQGSPAGLRLSLILPDNRQIILCHGSDFLVDHGEKVGLLAPVMKSGNSGLVDPMPTPSNPYAGAHLHTYGLYANGVRWNWTLSAGQPAGGGDKPLPTPKPRSKGMEFFAVQTGKEPSSKDLFFIYDVNDAQKITHGEAVAHNRAAGLSGSKTLFERIPQRQATLILDGVRFRRSRFQTATATATVKALDGYLDEIKALPDDGSADVDNEDA